jgi:hypothetical protein
MWIYIQLVIFLLVAFYSHKWLVHPLSMRALYAREFRKQGYKVLELPYRPWTSPYLAERASASKKKKDNTNVYGDYDVLITNTMANAEIIVLKPQLIIELLSPEKLPLIETCNERKNLSEMFKLDFITGSVPKMVTIADRVFD